MWKREALSSELVEAPRKLEAGSRIERVVRSREQEPAWMEPGSRRVLGLKGS